MRKIMSYFQVSTEQSGQDVSMKHQSCKIRVVMETFTKTIPDGDVRCEKTAIPKQLQITRRK